MNLHNSFIAYNDPHRTEAEVTSYLDKVAEGLFAVFATMGTVPIIRAKPGTAAEMTAQKLHKKLKDYLASDSTLFGGNNAVGGSFSRPILVLLDREVDYVSMLHHTSSYQALVHDLLQLKNNSVTIELKKGGKKSYHLDANSDEFWKNYAGVSFPEAVQNNDKELQAVTAKENSIRERTGLGNDDTKSMDDITTGMKDLMAVTDSLPKLIEKKKTLETHTNILSAAMEKIAKREVPSFYEAEEAVSIYLLDNSLINKIY